MDVISLLESNPVFETLNRTDIQQLLKVAESKHFAKNELVFSGDGKGGCFFLILNGSFLLSLKNSDSKVLGKGEIFGEVGVINEHMRSGGMRSIEESEVLVFFKDKLTNTDLLDPRVSLKLFLAIAKNVTNFLKSRQHTNTSHIIQDGEDEYVEFKSTLRYNLFTGKNDKAIEHAVLKTLAAFMNTNGGTLLVGVDDEGNPLGLDNDKFASDDKMLLHLNKLIQSHISTIHTEFVMPDIEVVEGKKVLRIDCEPATQPAYLDDGNNEYFYVRSGPSTVNLNVSEIFAYIKNRFGDDAKPV